MNLKKFVQSRVGGALGAVVAGGLGVVLLNPSWGFGRKPVNLSYDLHIIHTMPERDPVVMVYMDEDSYDILKQPYTGMWDRRLHARLLDRLRADGARAAVFDIVFSDEGAQAPNAEFAKSIKDFGKVVLAADKTPFARARHGIGAAFSVTPPIDVLLDAAATVGTAELTPDPDLIVRKHTSINAKDDQIMPLSWAAADMLGASFTKSDSEKQKERWVEYYGKPGSLPNVAYYRALDTNEIKPGFFKNKVVFIGARTFTKTAGERKDEYPSPYSFWISKEEERFMPGVEVQATLFLNLMYEDWLHRVPAKQEYWFILFLGILFGVGLAQLRFVSSALTALLSIILIIAVAYVMLVQTLHWFPWIIVVIQIFTAWLVTSAYNAYVLFIQKLLLHQQLGMYVSPALARKVEKSGDIFAQGAEKREVTILFSDIANFTAMCEGMDTTELQRVMNQYFENAVSKCIQPTDGMVIKFIGDAIFALWNTPLIAQADHQERACRSALLFREYGVPPVKIREGLEVRTRIGLHTGVADVGNFGSTVRVDYTAFGENINLSSRMEALNKHLGSGILMTGETEKAVRGKFITRFLGQFILKGFEKTVDVYELLGFLEETARYRAIGEAYAAALKEFQEGNFSAAETLLQEVLAAHPKDGPSKFLLKTLADFREHPPEPGWRGEIELKEK